MEPAERNTGSLPSSATLMPPPASPVRKVRKPVTAPTATAAPLPRAIVRLPRIASTPSVTLQASPVRPPTPMSQFVPRHEFAPIRQHFPRSPLAPLTREMNRFESPQRASTPQHGHGRPSPTAGARRALNLSGGSKLSPHAPRFESRLTPEQTYVQQQYQSPLQYQSPEQHLAPNIPGGSMQVIHRYLL